MKKIFSFNNIKTLLAVLLLCMGSAACKKLIEIPNPVDRLTPKDVFKDSAGAVLAIEGVYLNFGYYELSQGAIFNGVMTMQTGLLSDELLTSSADNTFVDFANNTLRSDNNAVASVWSSAYTNLYVVNACIEGINNSTGISEKNKQQFIGELKVVRAFYYFNLINVFGPVPLIKGTDFRVNATIPRTPVNEVYQKIVADLTEARQLLQPAYPTTGRERPNLHTATALLAKVYLYQQNWSGAETMAKEVLGAGIYNLETDLNNVFVAGSKEAIWQLSTIKSQLYQTVEANDVIPMFPFMIPKYYLSTHLLDAFESKDQRKTKWTAVSTMDIDGVLTDFYYPFKYKNNTAAATPREDYMVFRLGEQYLILAEAMARQGKLGEAQPYLTEVRVRSGLDEITPATQPAFLDAIMKERRTELFCEWSNRWFDLKRNGTVNEVIGAIKPEWQSTDALYPIPLGERRLNTFLEQNPGYTE